MVSNTGDIALEVSDLQTTGSWSVSADTLPQELAAGEALVVTVEGHGSGALTVFTSDGDIEVPLSATQASEPVVSWITPSVDGTVIPDTEVTTLQVEVSNTTELHWSSDVEGTLSATPVEDGTITYDWDPLTRQNGPYVVTVAAKNECSKTISERNVCQQEFYPADFTELAFWETSGNASWDGTLQELILTTTYRNENGGAFKTDQSIRSDKLDISFKVYLGNSVAGRYGLALTMLDAERMTSLEGGGASGMGYSGLPGWSIEFNTSTGSVGFVIDGNREQIQHATQLPSAKDGLWHDVDIMMEGNTLTVYYDDTLLINGTVEGNTTFPGYIGFSAATDDWVNTHKVADLTMNLTPCE
jgi:hypothetical protein